MRVDDTSIWVEWLIDSPLRQAIAKATPHEKVIHAILQLLKNGQ